jgi:hypothetical protein
VSTLAYRYDDQGNETMTKVCLAVRDGDTRPGADVMYRRCPAFFTGWDQNWRVLQQPDNEYV